MPTATAAALDRADAIILVITAQAPPSRERWRALAEALTRLPPGRVQVVANKLDLVNAADRRDAVEEMTARVAEALAGAPPLIALAALDATLRGSGVLAADASAVQITALRETLFTLARSSARATKLARANDAARDLGQGLDRALRRRRSAVDRSSDVSMERLLRLEADIDKVADKTHEWMRAVGDRDEELRGFGTKEKDRLAGLMAKKVAALIGAATFTWEFIADAGHRDRELARICVGPLRAAYVETAGAIRASIVSAIRQLAIEIGELNADWDAARSMRLDGTVEQTRPTDNDKLIADLLEEHEPLLQAIVDTAPRFEAAFLARCSVSSFRALLLRAARRLGIQVADTSPAFEAKCVRVLQRSARAAVNDAAIDAACAAATHAALQVLWGHAQSLAESLNSELHERKLALRFQHQEGQTERCRVEQVLERAMQFCATLKRDGAERRVT